MVLHHEFIKTAKKFSKKVAIVDKTTNRQITYSRALIAALILSKKIKKYKEGYIGIMIPTSAGAMLSILGTLMAGKVPVMINYSTGASDNSEYAQDKCGFKTIITSRGLLEKLGCRLVRGMVFIEDIMAQITTGEKLSAALKSKLPAAAIIKSLPKSTPDDNATILFTSGSEKDPKAVQLTHRNFYSNIQDILEVFNLSSDDIIMSILPLFHVFGHNVNFWLPLTVGMKAITVANPLEYKSIPKYIKDEQATMIAATPIFFSGYLRESTPGDFDSLRIIIAGADKVPDSLREGFLKKHNKVLLEGYGTTETSPVISANMPEGNRPGSIGKVFPSVQVKIVDVETGKEVSPGKEGKILVKGDLVMKGYLDDLEETSLHIRDGWYDTGDMGLFDEDGYLWHKGRLKRFVKIGGEMVSLVRTEIELEHALPEGVDCCVVDVPDSLKGSKIVAAITQPINEKEVVSKLSQKLPPIAMPRKFVVIEEMPKMGSGKIDFRTIGRIVRRKLQTENNNKTE
ncbi:bifunctional acyl-ACP--phospholipid O-acyltransferase/long-chain-fatty-acid--ACP ligase [candidate division KSB1 bacterium 4484_87]|nr:MAG: bifunctional acyl-ACP--phospholipid O-acyltransferase/long-chain-fatty-acid--ACP ligase [candidate division KSB1 bacterium 4484_87]